MRLFLVVGALAGLCARSEANVLGVYPLPKRLRTDEAVLSSVDTDSKTQLDVVSSMIAKLNLTTDDDGPDSMASIPVCRAHRGSVWAMCDSIEVKKWGIGPEGEATAIHNCNWAAVHQDKFGTCADASASAPEMRFPGGLSAAQWDEHVKQVTAGRRVVAPTPYPSREPATPVPTPPHRHTASFGDFKYVDGRVVLICPAGARRAATAYVLRGHADLGRCEECAGGRFQPQEDSTLCHACPPGKYNVRQGNVYCEQCAAGRFQPHAGMTFCYDARLRGEPGQGLVGQTFDADGRVTGQVAKPHYSPGGALQCCASKCMGLVLSAEEQRDPLWMVKNRAWSGSSEDFTVAPTQQGARADCHAGCRLWMRHSSLNWEGSHWRLGLLDHCSKDCQQAELTGYHVWNAGNKGVSSKGACMAGCKFYFDCMFQQDALYAKAGSVPHP